MPTSFKLSARPGHSIHRIVIDASRGGRESRGGGGVVLVLARVEMGWGGGLFTGSATAHGRADGKGGAGVAVVLLAPRRGDSRAGG